MTFLMGTLMLMRTTYIERLPHIWLSQSLISSMYTSSSHLKTSLKILWTPSTHQLSKTSNRSTTLMSVIHPRITIFSALSLIGLQPILSRKHLPLLPNTLGREYLTLCDNIGNLVLLHTMFDVGMKRLPLTLSSAIPLQLIVVLKLPNVSSDGPRWLQMSTVSKRIRSLLTHLKITSANGELWINLLALVLVQRPVIVSKIFFVPWLSLTGKVNPIMSTKTLPRIGMPPSRQLPTVS
jgi:hypothetical protein